jgi:hypothetical protein
MMKKIVSFSLFGTSPLYLEGAVRNAGLVPRIYPGWTTRFYVSQEVPQACLEALGDAGAEIVRKTRAGKIDGMFWRFLPAAEPELEAMVVRDVDSRPTEREFLAVSEWLESGRTLHVMRDHPCHRVVILGGMWGCRGGAVPDMADQISRWNLWAKKGQDQDFLRDVVYPRFRHSLMVHSDLYAYAGEDCRPFPIPRSGGEFVGSVVDADRDTLTDEQHAENLVLFRGSSLQRLPAARRRPKIFLQVEQWFRNWRDQAA